MLREVHFFILIVQKQLISNLRLFHERQLRVFWAFREEPLHALPSECFCAWKVLGFCASGPVLYSSQMILFLFPITELFYIKGGDIK